MKVTEHFALNEFKQPGRRGFTETPYPEEWIKDRLKPLCEALEVIRAHFGKPVHISSGYRTMAYNKAIGGAKTSQHLVGRACDFTVEGVPALEVHKACLLLYRSGKLKIGGLGSYDSFTHIDVREGGKRLARWSGSRKDN